ncbi:MAG: hypothetical protein K6F32_06640 [Bacilli bacterium]|nr:hypothetical protein [Bacilli bacterium]
MIKWFNEREKDGSASLYTTNLTLNATAAIPFENAYRVMVGVDGRDLVLRPLDKALVDRGTFDSAALYPIASHKSYARISSTSLMCMIAEELGITLTSQPTRFTARWDKENGFLRILGPKKGDL